MDALYEDCGLLLQRLAKIWMCLCTAAGLVAGICIFFSDDDWLLQLLLLLLCVAAGFLVGWISSVALYAFGVIVENVEKTRNNLFLIRENLEKKGTIDSEGTSEFKTPSNWAD